MMMPRPHFFTIAALRNILLQNDLALFSDSVTDWTLQSLCSSVVSVSGDLLFNYFQFKSDNTNFSDCICISNYCYTTLIWGGSWNTEIMSKYTLCLGIALSFDSSLFTIMVVKVRPATHDIFEIDLPVSMRRKHSSSVIWKAIWYEEIH